MKRILSKASVWLRRFLWVSIVITFLFGLLDAIFTFAQCQNPEALWNPAVALTTKCWDPSSLVKFSTTGNGE